MKKSVKTIIAIVLVFVVGLVGFGVYDKVTNLGSVVEQSQPNIPNFDATTDEDGLPDYILNNTYDIQNSDFVLPRVNETRGNKFDMTLYNYASFIVYSSAGISDTRGLVQTVDYQPFIYSSSGSVSGYKNSNDICSNLGGIKKNDYYFKVSKKSMAYALGENTMTVKDIQTETSYCNTLFSGRKVEFKYRTNQKEFERYSDISYFVTGDKVYKMTFINGYLKTMDIVFKAILANYTDAKNGNTFANFVCLNDLVTLEILNTATSESEIIKSDFNILMPFTVSYMSRINCDNDFVLSDNMSLSFS